MTLTRRSALFTCAASTLSAERPIRLLVVTGAHSFDKSFFTMFENRPEWKWEHRAHEPKSTSTVYSKPIADGFDAVVLYDMQQQITSSEQRNFLELFDKGKGVVVLHHALCSYQHWDVYNSITGYRMRDKDDGALPAFTYQHDTHFDLQRVEVQNPVLEGVPSFSIFDETYGRAFLDSGSQPLMMTNNATSIPMVVWARTFRQSRVVMIQPGHGPQIFADANFRKLVANAVKWVVIQ